MVKATPATQLHDPASEKSQNHHAHSANGEKNDCESILIDAFRWSRCKKPLPQKVMRTIGIPLPLEYVEVFLNHFSFILTGVLNNVFRILSLLPFPSSIDVIDYCLLLVASSHWGLTLEPRVVKISSSH